MLVINYKLASKNNKKDNKNKKKNNTKKESYTGFLKSRNFKRTVIPAVIIVVIVLVAVFNPFFEPPASIHPDTYYKVSDGDLLSNGSSAVFFLSWIGCPRCNRFLGYLFRDQFYQ